jgi:hypothetical protein
MSLLLAEGQHVNNGMSLFHDTFRHFFCALDADDDLLAFS